MGTETVFKDRDYRATSCGRVKLNDPLMGTETSILTFHYQRQYNNVWLN